MMFYFKQKRLNTNIKNIKAISHDVWRCFDAFTVDFNRFKFYSQKQSPGGLLQRKVFLEISQYSQDSTCTRVPYLIKLQAEAGNFVKKETLALVFSCEFCEISKTTFSRRTPPMTTSVQVNFSEYLSMTEAKRMCRSFRRPCYWICV